MCIVDMKTTVQNVDAMWQESTKEQREQLLETLGFNKSWSEANSIQEMRERGGAWVAKDLIKLWEEQFQ